MKNNDAVSGTVITHLPNSESEHAIKESIVVGASHEVRQVYNDLCE